MNVCHVLYFFSTSYNQWHYKLAISYSANLRRFELPKGDFWTGKR